MTDSTVPNAPADEPIKLEIMFGRRTYPADVKAVWGARLIWPDDLLPDRQDLDSRNDDDKIELVGWLNGGAIAKMRERLRDPGPYSLGLNPSGDEEAVIYEDEQGKIIGSAQGSSGYLYVCGWLHSHTSR